jgi:hypothetical protein
MSTYACDVFKAAKGKVAAVAKRKREFDFSKFVI